MTPGDKAEELTLKYRALLLGAGIDDKMSLLLAKEISLIQCDDFLTYFPEEKFQNYWQQVKEAIKKL